MSKQLNVKRSELVSLFEKLEFKTASKWNKARLAGKIQNLPELVDEDTDAGDSQELLDSLLNAIEKEIEVEITDDLAKPKDDAPKKSKGKKKPADDAEADGEEKPAKPKAEKPKKESAERDRFGSKIGTQCNLINETVTGKPQDIKTIAEASGMTVSRVKAHMGYLIQKGFVEKTDKGYKTSGDAPKAAKK